MSQPIIEVRGLSKRYHLGAIGATSLREEASRLWDRLRGIPHPDAQEFWALRDVSFEVKQGEVVGVIGRNGAGKSTLLKILSRITEPTSGTAKLRGRVASLLEVGTGFHPELTGRENVFLNGAILGMSRAEVRKKFDEIVAFAEVDQFIDTPVKRYSSGMYVRLAFAVAAHLEPEILIVDEVLAVGDAQFQRKCLGKIKSVTETEHRTVLFVSHNLQALSTLCTSAIFLENGRVRECGTSVGEVIAAYLEEGPDRRSSHWKGEAGDASVQLQELFASTSSPGTAIQTHLAIEVTLRVRITEPTSNLVMGVHLWSDRGYELAFSGQFDGDEPTTEHSFAPGNYTFTVTIPPDTLAEGGYRIIPNIGVYNLRRIVGDEVSIQIKVENLQGLGRRYLAGKGLGDVFRPNWRWHQSKT